MATDDLLTDDVMRRDRAAALLTPQIRPEDMHHLIAREQDSSTSPLKLTFINVYYIQMIGTLKCEISIINQYI